MQVRRSVEVPLPRVEVFMRPRSSALCRLTRGYHPKRQFKCHCLHQQASDEPMHSPTSSQCSIELATNIVRTLERSSIGSLPIRGANRGPLICVFRFGRRLEFRASCETTDAHTFDIYAPRRGLCGSRRPVNEELNFRGWNLFLPEPAPFFHPPLHHLPYRITLSGSYNMGTRVYIGKLPVDVRRGDIEDLFRDYGVS